jgi:hypothetical protein
VNATTYTFSGTPFNVPAGGSVNVDVYADTLSSDSGAPTVSPATTLAGCTASGQISFSSINCTSIQGQNLSFGGNPTITVSADSTEPPSAQVVMGSTGNTLGVYRFTETSNIENVKVTDLQVIDYVSASTANAKAAFSNLQLWNGSTLLGTAGSPVTDVAGNAYIYSFHFGTPIVVPQANSISVTLKGDASSYSSQGATDNSLHQFEVASTTDSVSLTSAQPVVALGATSNRPTTVSISGANGNQETVLRTTLAVTAAPLGTVNGRSKANPDDFGTVTLTANSAGPLSLNKLTFTFTGSAATSTLFTSSTMSLIDQNGNTVSPTVDNATETFNGLAATWTFATSTAGFQISAGSSYTFKLRLNTTVVPAISNQSESLSANVQSVGDVIYTDGLDASSTGGLSMPSASVPLPINSLSYAQGN